MKKLGVFFSIGGVVLMVEAALMMHRGVSGWIFAVGFGALFSAVGALCAMLKIDAE